MLIDPGRNDEGQVSEAGSVNLTDKLVIERYCPVMRIVSNVTCHAKEGISAVDALHCRQEC